MRTMLWSPPPRLPWLHGVPARYTGFTVSSGTEATPRIQMCMTVALEALP